MMEPVMKRVRGDGVEIQLAVWEGTGKTILCIHGITANCRCWDTVAGALAPEHRVLAMDLRGRGLSDKPDSGYSIDQHVRDIHALLGNLGLEKAVIMGHSLGAFISLAFGAGHPEQVERIILVDGGGKLSQVQMAKVFAGIKPSLDRLGLIFPSAEAYLDVMKQAPFLRPWSGAYETYFRYEIETVENGVLSRVMPQHIQEEAANLRQVDVALLYPQIRCPVLILRATEGLLAPDDILVPEDALERMLREIPRSRAVTVEGVNHYGIVFAPNPKRDEALRRFLRESP
jgi:pimeloyl-ACP methyl ester carboxylesterase